MWERLAKAAAGALDRGFSEPLSYEPAGHPAQAVRGRFVEPYHETALGIGDGDGGEGEQDSAPGVDVFLSDLTVPPQGDGSGFAVTRTATGQRYHIAEVRPDGNGYAFLKLLEDGD